MANGRHHPAVEADIERGWMSLTIACVLILVMCVGLWLFLAVARHHARNTPPPPVPSVSTAEQRIDT